MMEELKSGLNIEKKEKDILLKFGWLFKDSLDEFSTSIDRSLGYLDKIILPTIIASKTDKSYNPFSEIIEKYAIHILIHKLEKEGYKLLPLGFSSDLTLENNDHILSLDVKTANLDNPSDFRKTIPVGINQITHAAKLRINRKILPEPYSVYPSVPPLFKLPDESIKLILTYGLLFIYPSYRDIIEPIRRDYLSLFEFFRGKVKKALVPIIMRILLANKNFAERLLLKKPRKSRYTREELITESLIRGIFIHENQKEDIINSLNISQEEKEIIDEFNEKLKDFAKKLRERDIKPIAIIAISIPNGLLKDKYIDEFVSGKNYSKSARYHYKEGIFKIIKENKGEIYPRVLFLDINKGYVNDLKRYFGKIYVLDYNIRRI